jgi:malate dehydrogenase (oxaloacetate-decarboxylating)
MRAHSIDTIFRVRLRHQPGELARLTVAIAEQGGLLGEITTTHIGEVDTVRDITIETSDEAHTGRVVEAVRRKASHREPSARARPPGYGESVMTAEHQRSL